MRTHLPRRSSRLSLLLARTAFAAALMLAANQPAQAIVFWNEVTFYLTYASFNPGDKVNTTFTFGTDPAINLSTFEFTLTWDDARVTPVASGPGSIAEWATVLGAKGQVNYGFASPQAIKGVWTADPAGGSSSWITTDYATPVRTMFSFATSAQLKTPFVVTIELTHLKDPKGESVDTGSGFINWATMTPVPEPAGWLTMVCGLATLAALRPRRQA